MQVGRLPLLKVSVGLPTEAEGVGGSGERLSNMWIIYLEDWDNPLKGGLIPDNIRKDERSRKSPL